MYTERAEDLMGKGPVISNITRPGPSTVANVVTGAKKVAGAKPGPTPTGQGKGQTKIK